MERFKTHSIHAVTNLHGYTFWIRIVKHEPTIEMCIAKVLEVIELPSAKEWARAGYCICIATDNQQVIQNGHNFERLGQTFSTTLTPFRVLDYFLEELTRARTTFTDLIYGDNFDAYPPINVKQSFEMYKTAREVAALGLSRR
jgi:hypothetical protein